MKALRRLDSSYFVFVLKLSSSTYMLWKEDVVLARRAIEIDASDVIIALVQKLMSHHLGYQ
jgi:hypothetical protein